MKRTILTFITSILTACVFAKTMDTAPIPLKNIVVSPKLNAFIPLSDLPYQGVFNIYCHIKNPNYSKQNPVIVNVSTEGMNGGKILINGQEKRQVLLNKEYTFLEILNAQQMDEKSSEIVFHNFDSSDSITIEHCIANWAL